MSTRGYPRTAAVRAERRQAAEARNAANIRTPREQIAELDRRLGRGEGAVKERRRLAAQMKEAA